MKILLINPIYSKDGNLNGPGGSVAPLNLAYLAAYLRAKNEVFSVKIIDAEALGLEFGELLQEIGRASCRERVYVTV